MPKPRLSLWLSLWLSLSFSLTGCQPWYQREPLEIFYEDLLQIRLDIDWMNHLGEKPETMTALLAKDGDVFTNLRVTNEVDHIYYRLGEGSYKVLIFNYAFEDYATMRFEDKDSYSGITARANDLTDYMNGSWDRGVTYMHQPSQIGVAVDSFTITRDDIEKQLHFIDYRDRDKPDTISIVRRETVYDMTCNLNVYVRTTGINYMKSIVGSVTGLADGFNLSTSDRTTERGPVLLDSWIKEKGTQMEIHDRFLRTRAGDDEVIVINPDTLYLDDGKVHDWVCTSMPTFGLPFGDEDPTIRPLGTHMLTLHFTLLDGTVKTYQYDITRYLRYRDVKVDEASGDREHEAEMSLRLQLDLDVIVDLPLEYPVLPYVPDPEQPSGDASGFDATVNPWKENDPVDVDFK